MATTHFVIVDDTLPASKLTEMSAKLEQVDGIETVLSYNKFLGPAIEDSFVPEEIKEICKKDGKQLLMINSSFSAATEEENEQIDEMTAIVKSYDSGGMITGEGPLTKDLTTIADKDFIVTSILSTLAIFIIVAICFKSLTIPIVVVGSIELAIFINEAIPFFTGTVIPFIAPTVISCVQLGATVDYAILLTTRFREELQRGHDRMNAMRIAANAADRSIMSSALVFFCATFGVYLTCNIEMIKSICSMLARGSVISAIVIFFFLTPLLLVCEGSSPKPASAGVAQSQMAAAKKQTAGPRQSILLAAINLNQKKRSDFAYGCKHERSGDSHENKASDTKINLCRARALHPPDERMQRAGAAGGKHKRHDAAPCHRAARSTNVCPLYWKNPQI